MLLGGVEPDNGVSVEREINQLNYKLLQLLTYKHQNIKLNMCQMTPHSIT